MASPAPHPLFGQSEARADFGYWAKAAHWRADEAAALSLGFEPKYVNPGTIKPYLETSSDAFGVDRRSMLISRAVDTGALALQFSPADFGLWAARIKLELPRELRDAVADLTALEAPVGADLDHLGTENARLKIELEQYKIANKAADPRERRSLQKIIAGMASGKYGFTLCAPKHSATKEIVTDIELLGLSIDKDTVLKHLRDAFRDLEIS